MGRILTFTNSNNNDLGQKKRSIDKAIVIGPNAIKFITIAIFAILAIVYLTQSTAGAARGAKFSNLEGSKEQLVLEQERLEAEQTRLRALKEIDTDVSKAPLEVYKGVEKTSN
ncbi:MAG: hypothetical protein WCG48_01335 [Candidatus Berkelbacteria bacterium]